MSEALFADPPQPTKLRPILPLTAEQVKDALRRRHPGDSQGSMPGQWTCIEEWLGIDLLALNAWQKACVIGYEVKVSRSDMRRELLRPDKRAVAVSRTTEFYFAVPDGLYTDDEIAFEEPEWQPEDFTRQRCPGIPGSGRTSAYGDQRTFGGRCSRWRRQGKRYCVEVPVPSVGVLPDLERWGEWECDESWAQRLDRERDRSARQVEFVTCPTCDGKGYTEQSRVEREAPTLWVPRDVGLVVITKRGCRVVKRSPHRANPESIAPTRKQLNDLIRWVSHRPDPRHAAPLRAQEAA